MSPPGSVLIWALGGFWKWLCNHPVGIIQCLGAILLAANVDCFALNLPEKIQDSGSHRAEYIPVGHLHVDMQREESRSNGVFFLSPVFVKGQDYWTGPLELERVPGFKYRWDRQRMKLRFVFQQSVSKNIDAPTGNVISISSPLVDYLNLRKGRFSVKLRGVRLLRGWNPSDSQPRSSSFVHQLGLVTRSTGRLTGFKTLPSNYKSRGNNRPVLNSLGPCYEFVPPWQVFLGVIAFIGAFWCLGLGVEKRDSSYIGLACGLIFFGGVMILVGHEYYCPQNQKDHGCPTSQEAPTFQHDGKNVSQISVLSGPGSENIAGMMSFKKWVEHGVAHLTLNFLFAFFGVEVVVSTAATWSVHLVQGLIFHGIEPPPYFYLVLGILVFCALSLFATMVSLFHSVNTHKPSVGTVNQPVPIEILAPLNFGEVGFRRLVSGLVRPALSQVQVWILAGDGFWYRQGSAKVDGCVWSIDCQFGNTSAMDKPSGDYQIIAIADANIREDRMTTLPDVGIKSEIIKVRRARN